MSLCDSCVYQQIVRNTRGSVFSLCCRSRTEPDRFPKYPRMPVLRCLGFASMGITVTALSVTAVKGTRLRDVESIVLGSDGAQGDRRFFLVDEGNQMVNAKQLPKLMTIVAEFKQPDNWLVLEFDDGTRVEGNADAGTEINARAYGQFRAGQLVDGPFARALSEQMGRPLRLALTRSAVDRGMAGTTSVISRASLRRLAQEAGVDTVDARRFRMLIEIDGVEAHAEDDWVGHDVRVGDALLRIEGHVGRCLVTNRDPESGELTLPTLDLLRSYRADLDTTEPLAFGIYGRVLSGGQVRLGDAVTVQE